MFLVGLTGGIAAGKSVVSAVWEDLGAYVIDADILARQAVEPGSIGLSELSEHFGSSILNSDGSLNRPKLAEIIFNDKSSRQLVESIIHPHIRDLAQRAIASTPEGRIAVYVIPLLVESKSDLPFDYIVTVEAPVEEQIRRLVENRGLTVEAAKSRVSAQATPADRANIADRVLSSNQSLDLLKSHASTVWREICNLASRKDSN